MRFFILGGALTVLEWLGFFVLTYYLGVHYLLSSIVMFVVISALGIVVYRKCVFGASQMSARNEVATTYAINTAGICINTIILWILVDFMHMEAMLGKIVASFLVAFFGFFMRKKFVYKNKN